jgi:hypothetical protein
MVLSSQRAPQMDRTVAKKSVFLRLKWLDVKTN